MSCTKLTELDRTNSSRKGNCATDNIIDIFVNGPDTATNSFNEQSNNMSLNKNISVSLTSLQSAAKSSISEIDDSGANSWKPHFKWKRFGKVLLRGKKQASRECLSLKRPSIVLSNSLETVVVLNPDSPDDEELKSSSDDTLSQNEDEGHASCRNDLLVVNPEDEHRRGTLSPVGNGETDQLMEPFAQVQQTVKLASIHWEMVFDHKEEWSYCWHPLTLAP